MNSNNEHEKKKVEGHKVDRRSILLGGTTLAAAALGTSVPVAVAQAQAQAQAQPAPAPAGGKPNILVIWGDDIGIANISAYSNGLMGYETPNIDRIAREGIKFQHYYGERHAPRAARHFSPASTSFAPD